MQPHATGCVQLRLQLCSFVEIFEPVSVRLRPKKAKDRTGPDFKTLLRKKAHMYVRLKSMLQVGPR